MRLLLYVATEEFPRRAYSPPGLELCLESEISSDGRRAWKAAWERSETVTGEEKEE